MNDASQWYPALEEKLGGMARELKASLRPWAAGGGVFTPEQAGYLGQGLATAFIQAAIDSAHASGGGTVALGQGDYVSGTLIMRSRVRLMVEEGSRLLASTSLADYPPQHARRLTVQDTSMGMHQSLIFAENCQDIAFSGPGEIDGRGRPENFPGDETQQGTPGRPFLLRVIDCRRVHVSGLILRDSPCWMQNYLNCEDLLIENVTVRNHANYNNDGFDIDGCRRVWMHDCSVHSGDDALCFKGAGQSELNGVLVENCELLSACNAVKIGTDTQGDFRNIWVRHCSIGGLEKDPSGLKHAGCDSAVSLEMMDGGTAEDILLSDLSIQRAASPFFMRLEKRGRVKPGDPAPPIGSLRRAAVARVRGGQCGPRGSYFLGIPEKSIEDVLLQDVEIRQFPSQKPVLKEEEIGEMYGVYPDAHMIDPLGDAPAYALWARHIRGLTLQNYAVFPQGGESRPAFVLKTDVQARVIS